MVLPKKRELKKYGETILLFVVLCFILNKTTGNTDLKFIDFRLLYVVIISCLYGLKQGILAIILTCISYTTALIGAGIDVSYLIYSIDSWMPYVMYILTGGIIGYYFDKKKHEIDGYKKNYIELYDDNMELKKSYKELMEVKDQLQKQILTSKYSLGKVYEIAKELDTLNSKLIFFKTVNILENIMESDSVCIYMMNSNNHNYNRLMANSFNLSDKVQNTIDLDKLPKLKEAIDKNRFFINKDLDKSYPTYAAPIFDGEDLIALVMIYNVDFEKHTLYYQNLFQITVNLIQNSLVKAYRYNNIYLEKAYLKGTNIYAPKEFAEEIKILEEAKEEMNLKYIKAKLKWDNSKNPDIKEKSEKMSKFLRSTDFIGCDEENNFYAVFLQTDKQHVNSIKSRFEELEIGLELEA